MLIIALVLALIGLAALVAAVVTSNELIAWVCIGASVIGVLLLIADALRARRGGADDGAEHTDGTDEQDTIVAGEPVPDHVEDYPEDEATVSEPESDPAGESDPEIAGVTDTDSTAETDSKTDTDGGAGGAVDISPDPDVPPKS
ncbi:hypothetical protein SAMN04488581_2180 [Mycolicibacterium neoaurum]|uniref:phage holin family protein n=1 Tax=Mycolicibacterium neoaurum TaxID=1795 RepID=UPI00068E2584|nr:phage holin family protein [Mycolicibacterium neoaurum]SDD39041.1 hypothetical protein SAMN04488581_2180 [Mycolicibacterium neoaurum]